MKVSTERDGYNNMLSELTSERQEIQSHTQEVNLKFDNVQKEVCCIMLNDTILIHLSLYS